VNALGSIYMTKAVVPAMKQRGSGRIINVISQAGLGAKAERAVYNSSKWAMTGFTKSMQLELRPHGIAVTGFYPGALNTHLFDKTGNSRDMSRALEPEIAADAVVYVCGLADHVEVPEIGIGSLRY
jgi:short-subunit dehydrogenase